MNKFGKIFGIIVLLIVIVVGGLMAFVRYYLTEERVKALVIPQAETALGRKVAIGNINIGLFSGITIHDFLIKESDSSSNFVSAKDFVLSYELLPLLQKKFIISEIRLDEPTVQIIRDKNGKFNFSSLALLAEKEPQAKTPKAKSGSTALPIALTINEIEVNKAKVIIRDQLAEIPDVDATSSIKLNLDLGRTMQDLKFDGSFDFNAVAAYGSTKTKLNGSGVVTQKDFEVLLDTVLDDEQIHTEADIKNYLQNPKGVIALSSESLDIDKLLAFIAGLPKTPADKSQEKSETKSDSGKVIAETLPPGLTAHGTVQVTKAVYKGLTANDFNMTFDLAKGILIVKEMSAKTYGGEVNSSMTLDLNQPDLAYNGKFGLQSIQAGDFSTALKQSLKGMLNGSLQSSATFSGAGTSWQQLSKVLAADGSFTLTDGTIKGTPVSRSIANLLGLQELNDISFKNIASTFTIVKGGKVKVKSSLAGADLDAEAEGIVGLDGSLDLPLTFHLAPPLAEKLKSRASFTKYLNDEQGATTLHLKLAGTLKNPRPTLDMKGVQEQLQKSLEQEIIKKVEGSSQDSDQKTSPENLIKGLFGK
jgi:uncharacterized protein involved in outer membrane biogenesis